MLFKSKKEIEENIEKNINNVGVNELFKEKYQRENYIVFSILSFILMFFAYPVYTSLNKIISF